MVVFFTSSLETCIIIEKNLQSRNTEAESKHLIGGGGGVRLIGGFKPHKVIRTTARGNRECKQVYAC